MRRCAQQMAAFPRTPSLFVLALLILLWVSSRYDLVSKALAILDGRIDSIFFTLSTVVGIILRILIPFSSSTIEIDSSSSSKTRRERCQVHQGEAPPAPPARPQGKEV